MHPKFLFPDGIKKCPTIWLPFLNWGMMLKFTEDLVNVEQGWFLNGNLLSFLLDFCVSNYFGVIIFEYPQISITEVPEL